jgi:hypothetical protein
VASFVTHVNLKWISDTLTMESPHSQDARVVDYPFRNTYARRVQPDSSGSKFEQDNPALKFESDSSILDETITIVKEKVWSFRSALKAAAEALVNFGLPPQVVGYESVPIGEDDQLAAKNEGEAALRKVVEDEMLGRSSSCGSKSEEAGLPHRTGERSRLVQAPEDEDDTSHAFVESVRKEHEERKSLNRTYDLDEDEDENEGRN